MIGDGGDTARGIGTDNTPKLTAVLSDINQSGRGRLYLGPGKYRISARALAACNNLKIYGAGRGITQLVMDFADTAILGGLLIDGYKLVGGVITQAYVEDVELADLTITQPIGLVPVTNSPAGTDAREQGLFGLAAGVPLTVRGVRGLRLSNVEVKNSSGWSCAIHDCEYVDIGSMLLRDAKADGLHFTGGVNVLNIGTLEVSNVGDDALAFGYQPQAAMQQNITIGQLVVRGAGACGVAVYGPLRGMAIGNYSIADTWLSGIKMTPLALRDQDTVVNALSYIKEVSLGSGVLRNIGMRDASARCQGDGVAVGMHFDTAGGGTIDKVTISGSTVFENVRNGYIMRNGTVGTVNIGPGAIYGTLVAGGAGHAADGGGDSDAIDGSFVAIAEYAAAAGTGGGTGGGTAYLFSEDFDRPDTAPAEGAVGNGWTGPAGLANGKAFFPATAGSEQRAAPQSDILLEAVITIPVQGANGSVQLVLSDGSLVIISTNGSFIFYNASNNQITTLPGHGFVNPSAGDHKLGIKRVGNTVQGMLDGTPIAAPGTVTNLSTTAFIKFGDEGDHVGAFRYDAVRVSAAS